MKDMSSQIECDPGFRCEGISDSCFLEVRPEESYRLERDLSASKGISRSCGCCNRHIGLNLLVRMVYGGWMIIIFSPFYLGRHSYAVRPFFPLPSRRVLNPKQVTDLSARRPFTTPRL